MLSLNVCLKTGHCHKTYQYDKYCFHKSCKIRAYIGACQWSARITRHNQGCIPRGRELLTHYGPIAIIWFDTPKGITVEQSQSLLDFCYEIQPDCLVCGRPGNTLGDYATTNDNTIQNRYGEIMSYEPTLESLQQHPVPNWYNSAKLGIFIHWGLFSVPAWAPLTGELGEVTATQGWEALFANMPYAEWYLNSLRIEGSPTHQHHLNTYGPKSSYDDFVKCLNHEIQKWNPDQWAELFESTGARYVVMVTKHHDGFLLWPSEHTTPHKENYKANRDLVGELTAAVRNRDMKMGFYYSGGLDWSFNTTPVTTRESVYDTIVQTPEFIDYVDRQWRELIDRYQAELLWNDIGYPLDVPLQELLAYYYNTIPDGVVNDRFGQVTSKDLPEHEEVVKNPDTGHSDFTTPEYSSYNRILEKKWEANRGIGFSFGYNRAEGPDSYLSAEQAVRLLIDIVSKNGNLLLNVGPMPDGTIPELQVKCLQGLGAWLKVNGEAIFDTRPWVEADGETTNGISVRFTQKEGALYATLLDTPDTRGVFLKSLQVDTQTSIHLLGHESPLNWQQTGDDLAVILPDHLANAPAHTFKISPIPTLIK
jgi:alpha-L-fucosidase